MMELYVRKARITREEKVGSSKEDEEDGGDYDEVAKIGPSHLHSESLGCLRRLCCLKLDGDEHAG